MLLFFETSGHIAEVFSELLHKPNVRLAKKQVTIKTIFGAVLFFFRFADRWGISLNLIKARRKKTFLY